ncbi:hypothetical protein FBU59_002427, partial [Linderina macrospora]
MQLALPGVFGSGPRSMVLAASVSAVSLLACALIKHLYPATSLASLREFELYLDNCLEFLAEGGVVRSNSVDKAICSQLKLVLTELAPQQRRVKAFSPRMLISSLSQKGRWVSSMGEQDAQELFQMISSTLQSSRRESDASIFNPGFLTK